MRALDARAGLTGLDRHRAASDHPVAVVARVVARTEAVAARVDEVHAGGAELGLAPVAKDARRGMAGDLLDPVEQSLRPHVGVVDAQPHRRVPVERPRLGLRHPQRKLALQVTSELLVETLRQAYGVAPDRREVGGEVA
jgi:hypothetical protein